LKLTRFVWLILIGLIGFAGFTRWQNLSEEPLIMTDGQGYYAYLPAVFIHQDLHFSFVDAVNGQYYPEGKRAKFIIASEKGNVNKYFAGTAVLEAPFFVVGCLLAKVVGTPVDGYSWPFQLMVGLAAICYLVLGLYLLGKLLVALGFDARISVITLAVIAFGTNLFFYAVYEPGMSHVYSFFTVSAFLYFIKGASDDFSLADIGLAAMALGLTVLIRPTNALVVLGLPVVTGGLVGSLTLLENLFKDRIALLVSFGLFFALVLVQPLVYFVQTGSPMVWSYEGEGFDFSSPELFNVLFSYRKGLFVYCPVLFLALFGILAGMKRKKEEYTGLFLFLSVSTWIIASWWMWYYGGSYGHRAFIDYYPFFAIGIAAALHHGTGLLSPAALRFVALLFIPLQLVQTYQYNLHIIPFDNMNKEKFWNLFLRTGEDLAWYYSGYEGEDDYMGTDSLVISNGMEREQGWGNEQQLTDMQFYSGQRSALMGSDDQYGLTFRKNAAELPSFNVIRISGWVRSSDWSSDISFVCSIEDPSNAAYYWKKYPLRPQFEGTNEWSRVTAVYKCGAPRDTADHIVIYPMKSDGSKVYVDDLEVSFIQAK
jgi:hypothetical protein